MTSHSNFSGDDGDSAVVVSTVATVSDGVADGAIATATDTVIDGTATDTGTVKKQNFHTGLDPVSRTNNSAKPTEFNAVAVTADKVRCAQSSSLDTGSSPVWSVVAGTDADDNDHATVVGDGAVATVGTVVTVTNPDDETIVTSGNAHKSSFPRTRESRTNNSAQPTEFNAVVADTADKVRYAQLFSLDTGSSPVWSVVDGTVAGGDDRATVATVGDGSDDTATVGNVSAAGNTDTATASKVAATVSRVSAAAPLG